MTDFATDPNDDAPEQLKRTAIGWLALMVSGDATIADIEAFKSWRDSNDHHRHAFTEAALLWKSIGPVATAAKRGELRSFRVVASREPTSMGRRRFLVAGSAAAASIAVLAAARPPLDLWPSIADLMADYRTSTGERRHIAMDGLGTIEMNTRTSLSRPSRQADGWAVTLVSGEVIVEIGSGLADPLFLSAANGQVVSKAACYNVRRTGSDVRVTCIEGSVRLKVGNQDADIRAGQQATYIDRRLTHIASVDTASIISWRDGNLVFRDARLVDVIGEVNRYRVAPILLIDSSLANRLVTARFQLDRLNFVPEQIKSAFGVRVRVLPGDIVLVG